MLHFHHRKQKATEVSKPVQKDVVTSQPASTMQIELKNCTVSRNVYAFITGLAIDQGNQLMLMSADGKTPYYPPNPPAGTTVQPLPQDCAIPLGPPGTSVFATIPHIAGCRVWLSVESKLDFRLNPTPYGPALVEPSCTNPSDPNINHWWDFVELTYNSDQCFANIRYVPARPEWHCSEHCADLCQLCRFCWPSYVSHFDHDRWQGRPRFWNGHKRSR